MRYPILALISIGNRKILNCVSPLRGCFSVKIERFQIKQNVPNLKWTLDAILIQNEAKNLVVVWKLKLNLRTIKNYFVPFCWNGKCVNPIVTREFELFPSFDPQGIFVSHSIDALTMGDTTLLVIPSKLDGWVA